MICQVPSIIATNRRTTGGPMGTNCFNSSWCSEGVYPHCGLTIPILVMWTAMDGKGILSIYSHALEGAPGKSRKSLCHRTLFLSFWGK